MRLGMMIELDKCIGCQACVTACKERWDSGPDARRDWVTEHEHGTRGKDLGLTFYPGLCNQCEQHPCTEACPTEATYVDDNGVVVVDPDVCIGCGNCIPPCPYGARSPDPVKKIVEKCNFCAPYVARGEQPACVTTCLAACRHFGDLDDPTSPAARKIAERDAAPLFTDQVKIGPKVHYAPAAQRQRLLEAGVVGTIGSSTLTRAWTGITRPAATYGVPALVGLTAAGGLLANLLTRKNRIARQGAGPARDAGDVRDAGDAGDTQQPARAAADHGPARPGGEALPRHRFGMRFLHWFNAVSWIVLLVSGTALMITPAFALFGSAPARWISDLVGGQANLIRLHVLWGLLWAALIVPGFLYLKRGGGEALREILLTRDDLRWLVAKPLAMVGLRKGPLPPQDKYNAGQKLFALSALMGTALIIATGLVMTFHIGPPAAVSAAILLHKLAIGLALVGVAVHITMAAIIVDERPALRSMVTGVVDREHAETHSPKWVAEVEHGSAAEREGGAGREHGSDAERDAGTATNPNPDPQEDGA